MLTVLLAAQLVASYAGRAVAPLAPFLEAEFSLTKTQVGLLTSALFTGQVVGAVPTGLLTDLIGVRRMLVLAPTALAAGLVVLAGASRLQWVMLGLAAAGFWYGSLHSVTNKGIVEWFPPARRGTAVGIKQTGVTTGTALAAAVLPVVALWLGWRGAVGVNLVAVAVLGLACAALYRRPPGAPARAAAPGSTRRALLALLRPGRYWLINTVALLLNIVQFSVSTYLLLYFRDTLGHSLVAAAGFLALSELAGSGGRVLWGVLSDRVWGGRRQPAMQAIAGVGATALVGLSLLPPGAGGAVATGLVILLGLASAGFNGIWMNLASEAAGAESAGIATGMSLSIGSSGAVIGPPLFGLLVDATGSYRLAWQALAVLAGLVFAGLAALRLEARPAQEPPAAMGGDQTG